MEFLLYEAKLSRLEFFSLGKAMEGTEALTGLWKYELHREGGNFLYKNFEALL